VYRSLAAVPGPIDLVNVFRRPKDIPAHVDDILRARPGAVWMQLGIRHEAAKDRAEAAGMAVVMGRCISVEHRRLFR
jgi:predicted CoA-binding protein